MKLGMVIPFNELHRNINSLYEVVDLVFVLFCIENPDFGAKFTYLYRENGAFSFENWSFLSTSHAIYNVAYPKTNINKLWFPRIQWYKAWYRSWIIFFCYTSSNMAWTHIFKGNDVVIDHDVIWHYVWYKTLRTSLTNCRNIV